MSEQKICRHDSFESMCIARNDLEFDDSKRRYNETTEEHEVYYHDQWISVPKLYELWGGSGDTEWKCSDCGKSGGDMYDDVNDINPNRKVSQQPHGKNTHYCNEHGFVIPTSFGGEDELCPYHQRTYQGEEGTVFMHDEFNQDGEEL